MTPTPAVLLEAAQAYGAQAAALLRDLVRIRSVNGEDPEAAVSERLAGEARALGLDARLIARDPARPNAVVTWGEGPAAFGLIAHLDTVAAGDPAAWAHPPFDAVTEGGLLYGRGAADNKAGAACGLYTLAMLRDHGLLDPAKHRAILAGVVDEESGASSTLGVRHLLDEGVFDGARGAIYTYTSDIVCVGHRGLLRLWLTAHGQAVHTGSDEWARKEAGVNAVTGLADVLLALETLDVPADPHPAFDHLGFTVTPGTLFEGGEWASMVPARARALVDVRLMPGQRSADVLVAVQRSVEQVTARRSGLRVEVAVEIDLPAAAIPAEHPLAQTAQRYAQAVSGAAWPIRGAGPANEGYMLIEAGIPTLPGFGPTGGGAHAPDEWVALDSLPRTIAMYAGIIHDTLNDERTQS